MQRVLIPYEHNELLQRSLGHSQKEKELIIASYFQLQDICKEAVASEEVTATFCLSK
jgi:hypothetical protein